MVKMFFFLCGSHYLYISENIIKLIQFVCVVILVLARIRDFQLQGQVYDFLYLNQKKEYL